MKQRTSWIVGTAVAAALGVGTLITPDTAQAAKPKSVDEVQQALKEQYPDAKFEKVGDHNVNGVQVTDYRITTKEGDSTAQITQYGDFLLWGKPRGFGGGNAISQPAEDTLKGLFKGNISDVDVYQTSFYAIDIQTSGKSGSNDTFRLRFDPVGRLRAVERISGDNREPGMQRGMQKASGADAKKAEDYAQKYVKGAKVQNVYQAPGESGFYLVDMQSSDNQDEKIIVNSTGRILAQIDQVSKSDLPEPVSKAIDQYFNGERIQKVYREDSEFYQVQQQSAGGAVTIRIRPDGEVMSVSNPGAAEEDRAATASERQSPAKKSSNKKSQ